MASVKLTDVKKIYDNKVTAVHDFNLEIADKEFVVFVGPSGCGKSTIAHLLMRRHSGYEGSISVGDLSIQEIDAASFHRHITYVGHKPYFFHGSVAENLRLAKHNATESEMWHVLDLVGIGDALRRRQGLETVMSEDDLHLSGGQLQRISLARAILHDSDIYIFDEATSKMDGQSEQYALDAIYALAKRKTVILISHRLPNVMKADCIYVIEKGCVAEWGTHDQLLRSQGAYGMLWAMQRVGCNGEGGASHEA